MNSKRPSKSNLPNVPKPSKLLLQLQRGYAEPIFSLLFFILSFSLFLSVSFSFSESRWTKWSNFPNTHYPATSKYPLLNVEGSFYVSCTLDTRLDIIGQRLV